MGTTSSDAARFAGSACAAERRRGLWVVVLGPDGVGKSSVIAAMRRQLPGRFTTSTAYHLRARGRKSGETTEVNRHPHAQTERSRVVTAGKLLYLLAANWVSYWLVVRPQLRQGALVLFDRYFPDALVDRKRYRLPEDCAGLVAWVARAVPRPDVYLVLEAPVDVLLERKHEVESEELMRQCLAYHRLGQRLTQAALVDASRELDCVVREAVELCESGARFGRRVRE